FVLQSAGHAEILRVQYIRVEVVGETHSPAAHIRGLEQSVRRKLLLNAEVPLVASGALRMSVPNRERLTEGCSRANRGAARLDQALGIGIAQQISWIKPAV